MIVLVVIFFAVRSLPKTYKSRSQVSTGITESSGTVSISATQEFLQPFIIENKFANLIEICRSRLVIDKVTQQLLLHDLTNPKPWRTPKKEQLDALKFRKEVIVPILQKKLASPELNLVDAATEKQIQKLAEVYRYDIFSLLGKMQIERVKESDFIKLETEVENPELAAAIVNTTAEKLIKYFAYLRGQRSSVSVDYLNKLAKDNGNELAQKVDKLKKYKEQTGVINLSEQTRNLIDQVKNLEEARQKEAERIPALGSAIYNLQSQFSPSERSAYDRVNSSMGNTIAKYDRQFKNLNRRLISTNFDSPQVKDSIDRLSRMKDFEIKRSIEMEAGNNALPKSIRTDLIKERLGKETDLTMAKSTIRTIDNELGKLRSRVTQFAPIEATIGAYEREIDIAQDAYMKIVDKLNIAQAERLNSTSHLRLVELGQIAEFPESSKLGFSLALGLMVSILVCVVVIFLIEYFDQRIRSVSRFRRVANLPVLSSINLLPSGNLDLIKAFKQSDNPEDVTLFKAYLRHIRNSLIEDGNKVYLFTGFNGNEGKTTMITSIAYSLALLNKKVLLVDSNFKHNSMTNKFYAKQVLVKDEALSLESVSPTDLPLIDVVGTKVQAMSPAEILQTNGFTQFLTAMKQKYDFILMETASLEKNFDAEEMIPYCDKVIAVFAASEPIRQDDKPRLKFFHDLGSKFLGAVLNQVTRDNLEDIVSQQSRRSKSKWFVRSNPQAAASVVV